MGNKVLKTFRAFTLAEVLITLVIIGVVAAITVPTLMNNTNGAEMRSALKKAISSINQAMEMSFAVDNMYVQDFATAEDVIDNIFSKRMTVMKDERSKVFTNQEVCNGATFTTADGAMFCITNWEVSPDTNDQTSTCNSYNTIPCAADKDAPNLYIDVNGQRKPNRLTTSSDVPRDIYEAQMYNQRVVPFGDATQGVMYDKAVTTE